jgi:Ca2+-binding EF-hand superfamily protein
MVLLRWRNASQHSSPLVVVSTHLAKDPYNRAQTAIRVRQVAQIMSSLTEFTQFHKASDAPVILLGDLNANALGELRGIARTVWQIKGAPIHKFLWGATDVNTGATSITKARQCRIDVVQYLSSHMEVLEVVPVPKLPAGQVIPNAEHPSDHFPVCARFAVKEAYQKHRESARAWLECVAGQEKVHPLTDMELQDAFEWLDRDKSKCIHQHDMEEACLDLQCYLNADVQHLLLDCFPDKQISYEDFLRAYEVRLSSERMRCVGDLECAFRYFAGDAKLVELGALEAAFREITPISFSDSEVKEMIRRVNVSGYHDGKEAVNLRDFCDVVCRATFPNREVESRQATNGRISTKEIRNRLEYFHETSNTSPAEKRFSMTLSPSSLRGRSDLSLSRALSTIASEPNSPLYPGKANFEVQGSLELLEAELQGKLPLVEIFDNRLMTKD